MTGRMTMTLTVTDNIQTGNGQIIKETRNLTSNLQELRPEAKSPPLL